MKTTFTGLMGVKANGTLVTPNGKDLFRLPLFISAFIQRIQHYFAKLTWVASIAVLLTISSCSFVKDVQKHCRPEVVSGDIQTASFNVCLKCDSLAKVVWDNIQKQKQKQ